MLKLSQKLLLFVLAAAVVPLAFAGFWLLREAERELGERLEREQRALAAAAAEATGTQLAVSLESLAQSALLIDWARVTPEEASGGLRLLASQSSVVVGATLVDPARTDVQPFLDTIDERPKLGVSRDALSALLPLATLGSFGDPGQMALGPAQASPEGAWMPAAIQVGPRGPAALMVVLGLTLTVLDRWLIDHAPTAATLQIIDADGRVVASSAGHPAIAQLEEARLAGVKSNMAVVNTATEQLAFARVPGKLGLTAIAAVPLTVARAPIASLRKSALIGMGGTVLLLIVVSLFFTGGLSRRLGQLGSVAEAFGKGDLSQRASTDGGDELAALGQTFNSMGAELETSRAKLMRWNDELKQRVDEATADLRAAQAQLLETQKLAAIGQLGAGVAHEINNPLVGILGNAQLMLMDVPDTDANFALLKSIEESAVRCREITQQLLRFSQKKGEVALAPIDLVNVVKRAMALERERSPGVTVEVELPAEPVRVDGDAEQLEQVLAQLCSNARTAMKASETKKLTVTVSKLDGGGALTVSDTGKGIAKENLERIFEPFFTTKDVWTNIGLGLAVAYRVVQEHEGRIDVQSEPGQGARFVISLKAAGTTQQRGGKSQIDIGGQGKGITG